MVRTVWVGLIFLIAICGLTAYKVGFAASAANQAASAAPLRVAVADVQGVAAASDASGIKDGPATKTDRLDVDYLRDVPDRTLVHTIPIVISNPGTPAAADPDKAPAPEKNTRSVSRHWRSSYARYTRRHFRHPREVAHPATEAKSAPGGLLGWLRSSADANAAKR